MSPGPSFAVVPVVGGILLALGSRVPISPYVTTLSFAIYLVCRLIGSRRTRCGWRTPADVALEAPRPDQVPQPRTAPVN